MYALLRLTIYILTIAIDDYCCINNTNIDNRLACLVWDIIEQEDALLVMAVVAVFGIQLFEPFHAVTISKISNHKTLQVFLQDLYSKMIFPISEDFFKLETPWYPSISEELFDNVIKGYKTHVVQSVKEYALHHLNQAVKLANFFHPDLADILIRQRKDYGLSDRFEA